MKHKFLIFGIPAKFRVLNSVSVEFEFRGDSSVLPLDDFRDAFGYISSGDILISDILPIKPNPPPL